MTIPLPFDNSYARLGVPFLASVLPTPVPAPKLVKLNRRLALDLGLDPEALASPEGIAVLAGNAIAGGSEPVATAYAGHQFGSFVQQLGDGRAILLGEVIGLDGNRRDLQLKGSGPTPYSRRGDGRAALGPVLREYIVSEAMAALGIPTTRALAAVTTGDWVARETALPGAILTRVAASHIRVGTFQFFAARKDLDALRRLAGHVIARHYPEAAASPEPYRALLAGVIARQAALVARWMHIGFIHGVMNTDNMSVAGETIDYGPCAFMDVTNPSTVFSSIDYMGRYAYKNQPGIAHWNLARLAEALLPLLAEDPAEAVEIANGALAGFVPAYDEAYLAGLRQKLGLLTPQEDDAALAQDLLARMTAQKADFTLTFRRLSDAAGNPDADGAVRALFAEPTAYDEWAVTWRARLAREADRSASQAAMRQANPAFIPRNHRVEAAIAAAVDAQDFAPFEELMTVLAKPYEDQPEHAAYAAPPAQIDAAYQTLCGT
jgi:uncharacterized protein YdiU (UPF0061 family)